MAKKALPKDTLLQIVCNYAGVGREVAAAVLDGYHDAIRDAVAADTPVQIQNFGTFDVSIRAARKGRNPKTGEEIEIAESRVVKFKPAQGLKDAVNA